MHVQAWVDRIDVSSWAVVGTRSTPVITYGACWAVVGIRSMRTNENAGLLGWVLI